MKFFITTILFTNMLYANDSLRESVNLVNKSFSTISNTGKVKLACSADIVEKSPVILTPEFSEDGVDDNCFKYIDDDGKIGPWGQTVINTINKLPKNEIRDTFLDKKFADMDLVCPNFSKFDDSLKMKFWVWTFASISWQESNCKPKVTAQGTNSKAVGLLQLEDSRRLREGRGDHCEVADIINPNNNIACGVEILHQQLLGPKSSYFTTSTGELFWKGAYWQHLRYKKRSQTRDQQLIDLSQSQHDHKSDIKELVMRFPYCR